MSIETARALGELKKSLVGVFGDVDISNDFIQQNFEQIQKAIKGDESALDDLEKKLNQQYLLDIGIDISGYENLENIQYALDELANKDYSVGMELDDEKALIGLQQFLGQAKLTKDKANEILNQMGWNGELEEIVPDSPGEEPVTVTSEELTYTPFEVPGPSYPQIGPNGQITGYSKPSPITYYGVTRTPKTETKMVPIDPPHYWVLKSKDSPATKENKANAPTYSGLGGSVTSNGKGAARVSGIKGLGAGKKSGGGGDNKPDKMDPLKNEIDRYHKVNTQITKVDNNLKRLQSQQDKFIGGKKIANLNAQWQELNTQISNYNEKLRIAIEEQKELANELSKKGVQFNADGTVSNYAESLKAQEAYVNSLIDKYNSMSKKQQESYKETVENAKKEFEDFKKNIDRYDELVSDFIPDLQQSIQDTIDKQVEINVEKFNMEIEITLNMDQATRDWNA